MTTTVGSDSEKGKSMAQVVLPEIKTNPAIAESDTPREISQTPDIHKITINKAFMRASDAVMVDSCMRVLEKGESDSPVTEEKSNKSAPAARLF